jgi:uncharacterized protein (TIGR00645 family)
LPAATLAGFSARLKRGAQAGAHGESRTPGTERQSLFAIYNRDVAGSDPMTKPRAEMLLERTLFASRWVLAPMYLGLALALLALLAVFCVELYRETVHLLHVPAERLGEAGILMALGLIDLSLSANLLLIVIFSGYENFISRIETVQDEKRPNWMGTVDFSGLKMKLIASIVAISAISLLRTFLSIGDAPIEPQALFWQVALHLTFVASGVFMAVMDWIVSKTDKHGAPAGAAH